MRKVEACVSGFGGDSQVGSSCPCFGLEGLSEEKLRLEPCLRSYFQYFFWLKIPHSVLQCPHHPPTACDFCQSAGGRLESWS